MIENVLAKDINGVEPQTMSKTHTPRHWKDAASRKKHLVAIESRSCFSLWKVNRGSELVDNAVILCDLANYLA
jgi:hypothetical protein